MNDLAVIMCTWKRIENFRKTLEMLINQDEKDFDLKTAESERSPRNLQGYLATMFSEIVLKS